MDLDGWHLLVVHSEYLSASEVNQKRWQGSWVIGSWNIGCRLSWKERWAKIGQTRHYFLRATDSGQNAGLLEVQDIIAMLPFRIIPLVAAELKSPFQIQDYQGVAVHLFKTLITMSYTYLYTKRAYKSLGKRNWMSWNIRTQYNWIHTSIDQNTVKVWVWI